MGLLVAACLGTAAPAAVAESRPVDPARELARTARPLSDLGALDRVIGPAKVVGIGEATHSSAEFFENKHRIFEHLVEKKGFTTFALEAGWSTGLRIDDYVRFGKGDPKEIMREEFQNAYRFWNTEEYLDLIMWMRQHNLRHPDRPVRFMGNDIGYAGPGQFDLVTGYVARTYPKLLPRFEELYRASRPVGSVDEWMRAYVARPREERQRLAADVQRAHALLAARKPGRGHEEHAWMVQHARVIAQVGTEYAYDLTGDGVQDAMLYRDRAMAENTVWWQRRTGHRMLLSAHNGHIGYETTMPDQYPRLQGAYMRDALGPAYVSVGTTFGRGSFNAADTREPGEPIRTFTVGVLKGGNEETLGRVSRRDFVVDLRKATPRARAWLNEFRPTRSIGTAYPWPGDDLPARLATSYDALIHLHDVSAARLR
ncbi:erythromycin esterase family protein [Streptomyces purpureus]|uniref:erythromycin esterase family protein n=1 Tax=Streptomyces purpureus TaxID=1951 RepID=UPI001670AB6A|nr:erythromycin esterase family protein [Streptomyces purpureus]